MSAAASQGNFEHINVMLGKLEQLAIIGVCCNFSLLQGKQYFLVKFVKIGLIDLELENILRMELSGEHFAMNV